MFAKGAVSIIEAMSEPSSSDTPPSLDPIASARWAAWPHAASPWLNEEIGRRMEDRLQWIRLQPTSWVGWAPVSGGLQTHAKLRARYPQAQCHVVETSPQREQLARQALQAPLWKRWLQSDALAFGAPAAGSADMLWANMALHNHANPQALLQQWHQAEILPPLYFARTSWAAAQDDAEDAAKAQNIWHSTHNGGGEQAYGQGYNGLLAGDLDFEADPKAYKALREFALDLKARISFPEAQA